MGEWIYRSTFSWSRHYMEVSCQLHTPAALHPGKGPQYPLDSYSLNIEQQVIRKCSKFQACNHRQRNLLWRQSYVMLSLFRFSQNCNIQTLIKLTSIKFSENACSFFPGCYIRTDMVKTNAPCASSSSSDANRYVIFTTLTNCIYNIRYEPKSP
jgi:hypothetical protein